jgi:hypothetical protein
MPDIAGLQMLPTEEADLRPDAQGHALVTVESASITCGTSRAGAFS